MKYWLIFALLALSMGCREIKELDPPDTQVEELTETDLTLDLDADELAESDIEAELVDGDIAPEADAAIEVQDSEDLDTHSDLFDQEEPDLADLDVHDAQELDQAELDADIEDLSDVPFPPGEYEIEVAIGSAEDVLASYLMVPGAGEWNIFYGATVPVGRRTDDSHVSYYTAFRFQGVEIPPLARIESATLSWTPHNTVDSNHQLCLNIYGELSADSPPFDPSSYYSGRPDQRLHTGNFIDRWVTRCVSNCNSDIEYDCEQRELDCWNPATVYEVPKDLKAIVQEIVDYPGWDSGQALTLLVVNSAGDTSYDLGKYNDNRTILGFELDAVEHAPKLSVRFVVE